MYRICAKYHYVIFSDLLFSFLSLSLCHFPPNKQVLHGTHNVTLDSNTAYDTFGHCYFLEDGAEEDNVMRYNLGALTKAQPQEDMISQDETDDEPATFWLTNPVNTWEGNVAAGSERSGFWFESE